MATKNKNIILFSIIAIGATIGYFVLKAIDKSNDNQSNDDKDKDKKDDDNSVDSKENETQSDSKYSRSYGKAEYISFADKIYGAKGTFNDDEEAIYDVFKKLKTIGDINELNNQFFAKYKVNLPSYLKKFLSVDELKEVDRIINASTSAKIPYYNK